MNAGMRLRTAWLAAIGLCAASLLHGQSLGDVARKEKERRAGQACPPRVITNDDLLRHHAEAPAPSPPSPTATASPLAAPASAARAEPAPLTEFERAERYWRQRAAELRWAVKAAEQNIAYIRGST